MNKKILLSLIVLGGAIIWLIWPGLPSTTADAACRLSALDVGQGDALLIRTPDRQDILIDGGPSTNFYQQIGQTLPPGDHDLELIILTHPHADHVNGLVEVLKRFDVHKILDTGVQYQQNAYREFENVVQEKKISESRAAAGQRLTIGTSTTLDVLWPAAALSDEKITKDNASEGGGVNDTSIVMKLTCGGSTAMLTGDAASDIEERLIERGSDVRATLLKVGHHGSRFSTSVDFLQAVRPTWALISVGRNNHYQHPHPSTLARLQKIETEILRTDERGTITMVSDGRGGWTVKN